MEETTNTGSGVPWKIYIDESRISGCKYMLMGSIWIRSDQGWPFVNYYHNTVQQLCGIQPNMLKWTNVPSNRGHKYVNFYTTLVDAFFQFQQFNVMFYRCLIVDSTYNLAHPYYHHGDPEVGFHKLYYELIQPVLECDKRYHVRIAERPVNRKRADLTQIQRVQILKDALNASFRKRCPSFTGNIVDSVDIRKAADRRLIQLADVLTGAVGFHWEELHQNVNSGKGLVKAFLANYIAQKMNSKDLCFTTLSSDRKFNIFHMRLHQ